MLRRSPEQPITPIPIAIATTLKEIPAKLLEARDSILVLAKKPLVLANKYIPVTRFSKTKEASHWSKYRVSSGSRRYKCRCGSLEECRCGRRVSMSGPIRLIISPLIETT